MFLIINTKSSALKKNKRSKPELFLLVFRILLVFCALFIRLSVYAQQQDTVQKTKPVKAKIGFAAKIIHIGKQEAINSIAKFEATKIALRQDQLIEDIKATTHSAKEYLKGGIDTLGMNTELKKVQSWYAIAGDGVFTNKGTAKSYRDLVTTSKILHELLSISGGRKRQLDKHHKYLVDFQYKLDSLSSDTLLYEFPADSVAIVRYFNRIKAAAYEIGPTDTALNQAIIHVNELQTQVNLIVNKISSSLDEIDGYQQELSARTFDREFANLGGTIENARPFSEILHFSQAKGYLVFLFYAQNNKGKILLIFFLVIALTYFLKGLKRILIAENVLRTDFEGQLILRYPLLSSVVIILNVFQFIFAAPPFIFNALFWMLSAISLTFIFRNFITKYGMNVWLIFLLLFVFACADNLILQASRIERWGMLILGIAGVFTGSIIVTSNRKKEFRKKLIIYFIGFVVILDFISIIANVFGRYNLSKTLLTSGYFNVIIGILFLWTVRLINEGLSLAFSIYTKQEKKLFYINFELVGKKVHPLFYLFLIVGWFILFMRNFFVYKLISEPLKNFLFTERVVGDYAFTIGKILTFFMIMAIAVIISRVVSFFATDRSSETGTDITEQKTGVGSWLLLIRITIISLGLFVAFAAAGIPMDRITIILGALGVGIGFGLQPLANNLISGLIVSFEKPVNVGDIIEINGQSGTMKSIGFRSSILTSWDGAEVIIPNGDLLNAHLVNWTMGNPRRRIDIIVGVSYGTDLQLAKQVVSDLLKNDERIYKYPAPTVLVIGFNSSSIDLKVLFWVRHIREMWALKSDIITAIDVAFKENGIVIPFPQHDLHIRSGMPDFIRDSENEDRKH